MTPLVFLHYTHLAFLHYTPLVFLHYTPLVFLHYTPLVFLHYTPFPLWKRYTQILFLKTKYRGSFGCFAYIFRYQFQS